MKQKLTFAIAALLTSSAFAAMPAAMPEFKNEQQLAQWRAEVAAKHVAKSTDDYAFYTGKPYIESTSSYTFNYRSYKPELARWTSEDPSGFPDGANAYIYAPTPTSGVDFLGLWKILVSITGTNNLTPAMVWSTDGDIGARATIGVVAGGGIPASPVSSITIGGQATAGFDPSFGAIYYSGVASIEATIGVSTNGQLIVTPGASTPENLNGSLKVGGNLNFIFDDPTTKKSGSIQMHSIAAYNSANMTGIGLTVLGVGLNATWTAATEPSIRTSSGSISFTVVE